MFFLHLLLNCFFLLGEVMGDIAKQLLGVKKTSFEPQHTRNLGNQFRCFSNFDIEHNKNSF